MPSIDQSGNELEAPRIGPGKGTISLVLAVLFIILCGSGAAVWFIATRPPSDREVYAMLSEILLDHRAMRDSNASTVEWDAFEKRSLADFEPILRPLEQYATATEPAKQQLLWAGRDYLPMMLRDARLAPSDAELQFEQHLEQAARFLR